MKNSGAVSGRLKPNWLQAALENIVFIRDNIVPKLLAYDNHDLRLCCEIRSIVLHLEMKLRASMFRKESRWYHYREDYPLRDDENWICWIKIQDKNGEMTFTKVPIPEEWLPGLFAAVRRLLGHACGLRRYVDVRRSEPEIGPDP